MRPSPVACAAVVLLLARFPASAQETASPPPTAPAPEEAEDAKAEGAGAQPKQDKKVSPDAEAEPTEEPKPKRHRMSEKDRKQWEQAWVALQAYAPDAGPNPIPTDADIVRMFSRVFFSRLLLGDARSLVSNSSFPFYLEDRRYASPDELLQEWLKNLREKRVDLLTLYGVEVFTPGEMEKKFGKPPARLQSLPWRAPHTYLAVANLSGHAAIAVVQDTEMGWRVVGYTD